MRPRQTRNPRPWSAYDGGTNGGTPSARPRRNRTNRRRRAATDGSARGSMRLCGPACNRCVGAPGFSGKECSAGTGHGTAMGPVPDQRAAVLGWISEQVTVRPRCSFSWPVPAVESTSGSLATSATRGVLRDGLFVWYMCKVCP